LPIYPPLQHSKYDIVVSSNKTPNLGRLSVSQCGQVCRPFVASGARDLRDDVMDGGVESRVYLYYEFSKIR
jgi:hypothetical protein